MNGFGFSEKESEYLESVNREYDKRLSPYACKNNAAIYCKAAKENSPFRTPFNRDADVIFYSAVFHRYGIQENPLMFSRGYDLLRRSFHASLVSKMSREIGRVLKLNCDLIEAIVLGLDLGHTPFGDKGESYLSDCYFAHTGKYFRSNVQSARIFRSVLNCNVSLQVLSGILCHKGELTCHSYAPAPLNGFDLFDHQISECYRNSEFYKTLRPNTLEGCLVRVCDAIAYIAEGPTEIYRSQTVPDHAYTQDAIPTYKNKDFINHLMINLVKNSIESPSLNMDETVFRNMQTLIWERNVAFEMNEELNAPYETVIKPLIHALYERLLHDIAEMNKTSPIFDYMKDKIQGRGYFDCDPIIKTAADPNDIVTDFIASMTDDSFIETCKRLHICDELTERNF